MNPADRIEFFRRLKEIDPQPTTELVYQSNFELLISVILSAQATDVSVNLATRRLYRKANTPQAIVALGEEGLKAYIKTIGLFKQPTLCSIPRLVSRPLQSIPIYSGWPIALAWPLAKHL